MSTPSSDLPAEFSASEFEALDDFLYRCQGGVDLSMFDGFLPAAIWSSKPVDRNVWLSHICSDGDAPLESGDESDRIIPLVLRRHNRVRTRAFGRPTKPPGTQLQ
jgi:hypothetical protein